MKAFKYVVVAMLLVGVAGLAQAKKEDVTASHAFSTLDDSQKSLVLGSIADAKDNKKALDTIYMIVTSPAFSTLDHSNKSLVLGNIADAKGNYKVLDIIYKIITSHGFSTLIYPQTAHIFYGIAKAKGDLKKLETLLNDLNTQTKTEL